MDDFNTLSQRLLSRCPSAGLFLSQQLINDSWHTLQSRREWSWRRRHGTFAPPNIYAAGFVSTNVGIGQPTLITGIGTTWTPQMVGSQVRVGGLMYPYYTVVQYISPTQLMIDQPWAGPEQVSQPYQILQLYFPVPSDFGYWYTIVSTKDGYRLWTDKTEADLAIYDPQRTNTGQTYAVSFLDYSPIYGGVIGQPIQVSGTGAAPISTTSTGYSYVANATYIIQVLSTGISGTATYQWMRAGQTAFTGPVTTADFPIDLMDGVQIYWPDVVSYTLGDIFVINAQSTIQTGVPRYELWPAPTYAGYLYPYIYIAKEYDLTVQQPTLPPFIANRGEVLLEMGLAACARWPGASKTDPNPYFNLALASMHDARVERALWDLERNDEEIGVSLVDYQMWPMAMAPWMDGNWQQSHAPFLVG